MARTSGKSEHIDVTATILLFPRSRMLRSKLPSAIDVAFDHVLWLRQMQPWLSAREAGLVYGLEVVTWAELVIDLAAMWEELPGNIRRQG